MIFLYLPSYNLPGISVIKEMCDIHISTTNKTDGHDTCITEILLKVLLNTSMYNITYNKYRKIIELALTTTTHSLINSGMFFTCSAMRFINTKKVALYALVKNRN